MTNQLVSKGSVHTRRLRKVYSSNGQIFEQDDLIRRRGKEIRKLLERRFRLAPKIH